MLKVSNLVKVGLLLFYICRISIVSYGQIRVESFFGDDESVVDVFWVKPFQVNSSFLYLSRNKLLLPGYKSDNPQFSTLNILSYQLNKTGIGLAVAASANNAAFQGRVGVQFLKVKPNEWLIYTIASTKLSTDGDFRQLLIAQCTPMISNKLRWFNRVEWVSAFGYNGGHRFSQAILKEGMQIDKWQLGVGLEWLWLGVSFASIQQNWGVFLAREF